MNRFELSGPSGRLGDGAASFAALLNRLADISNETAGLDGADRRDYRRAAREVESSLGRYLFEAGDQRRDGYLRALTDLLVMVADGVMPSEQWDPLGNTARSFSNEQRGGVA